jgi:hypothetical protein
MTLVTLGRRAGLTLAVLLVALMGVSSAQSDFDAHALVARWVHLWRTYDLDLVDELFLADDRLTYFSSEKEGLVRGIDAVREHHRGFGFVPGGKAPEQQLWVDDVQADRFGDTAVVTAIWYFGDPSRPASENQRGPMTMVYVRDGETFRIAHLHFANY